MRRLLTFHVFLISIFCSISQSHAKDKNSNKVTIFEGYDTELPENISYLPNDATISHYYIQMEKERHRAKNWYKVYPSEEPKVIEKSLETHPIIDKEMATSSLLSYLYFEDGKVIYDALPPDGRFTMKLSDSSYFISHSMGKSIVSYLAGHAICEGYIESVDAPIRDWKLMEDTLYYGQPLINLLNMASGDSHVVPHESGKFHMNSDQNLYTIANGELKGTKPQPNAKYSYSNFTTDVIMNYIMERTGDDFDKFFTNFYQNKIKIEYPIFHEFKNISQKFGFNVTTKARRKSGAAKYGIMATRYDFLRVAIAMMEDWQNDSCEGKYLKEIYDRRISMSNHFRASTWSAHEEPGSQSPGVIQVSASYGGQFFFDQTGLKDRPTYGLTGNNGQQILIDMKNSRIVVISAAKSKHFDAKALIYAPIKYGRISNSRDLSEKELSEHERKHDGDIINTITPHDIEVEVKLEPLKGPKDGCSDPMFAAMMGDKCN